MTTKVTTEEKAELKRLGDDAWYWLRKNAPEVANWETELYDLIDRMKGLLEQYRTNRISLAFLISWSRSGGGLGVTTIADIPLLQKQQNFANSQLVFEMDLDGVVLGEPLDLGAEIDPTSIMHLSSMRSATIVWFGNDLDVYYNGLKWNPKNKSETLKEIKSKKRDRLLPITDQKAILRIHYEQFIKNESGVHYWFPGKKNEILQSAPEKIFQKSLYMFLKNDVDCIAGLEHMFKDSSRCDIRASVDYDIYFFEIKWIGFCAVKKRDSAVVSAIKPNELDIDSAIAGAYQTKAYIEQNNSIEYDDKIKLGVMVVYDAYPKSRIPIDYPQDLRDFPLLDTAEFALVTTTPSVLGKTLARRRRRPSKKR
jgi:hypothetical protein